MGDTISLRKCTECVYYRHPVSLSGLIAIQVTPTHEEAIKALDEISGKEETDRLKEAAWLATDDRERARWQHRPHTAPYCARFEQTDGWYYVCELLNEHGDCEFFEALPADRPDANCATCRYRVKSDGDDADWELLHQIQQRMVYIGGMAPIVQAEYDKLFKAIGPRKAAEIREAYQKYGRFREPPRYLDYCGARTANGFHIAESLNSDGRCTKFCSVSEQDSLGQ
jgi:hypothetical protein